MAAGPIRAAYDAESLRRVGAVERECRFKCYLSIYRDYEMVGRKEASMPQFVKVGTKTDFESLNTGKLVQAGGQNIAIFKAGGNFCAIENTCPHAGGPLAEGSIAGEVVTCPWHRSEERRV